MPEKSSSLAKILCALSLVVVLVGACLPTSKPVIVIVSPAHGSQFREGETIAVQSTATDARGVARVELLVDGVVVRLDTAPTPQTTFTLIQRWQAVQGTHTLMVRAYNTSGAVSDPAAISIVVGAASASIGAPTSFAQQTPGVATPLPPRTASSLGGCERPPVKFQVQPASIAAGESARLAWYVRDATLITLSGGAFANKSEPAEGAEQVSPATTTTYTLHVESNVGKCDAQVTLVVVPHGTPPPTLGQSTPPTAPPPTTPAPSPTAPSQAVCQDEVCMADGIRLNYLIVTRPLFAPALTSFINWKTAQGYRVGMVTVDWLAQRFTGRHLAERMKTGMHTLRRRTGLRYALLVGDTEVRIGDFSVRDVLQSYDLKVPWNVPTGFYTRKDNVRDEAFISDMYFVEDKDWDPQNTGRNPMPQQNTGVLAEGSFDATLFLGRWTVRRAEEIAPIVAKTQAASPVNKILFTSDTTLSQGTPYPDASCLREPPPSATNPRAPCYSDAMGTVRLRVFENNAPWLRTESLFVDSNNQTQVDQLFNRLSSYDGVVVGLYHGAYNCWISGKLCPNLQTTDKAIRTFGNFRLNNFPLLVADGCYIAAFYAGAADTVFESFLKASFGPAIIAQAPNNYTFLSALRDGHPVGQAFWRSGAYYFIWGNPIHLLGDPSLQALQGSR